MWLRRLRMRKRWFRLMLPVMLPMMVLMLLMAGCGSDEQEDKRLKSYGNDGYMGLSNSHPQLPRTGSAWNYEQDAELVAQVLRPLQGIRDSRMTITGDEMNVTLQLQSSLSREEAARLTSKAKRVLADNFPRYDVHVRAEQ